MFELVTFYWNTRISVLFIISSLLTILYPCTDAISIKLLIINVLQTVTQVVKNESEKKKLLNVLARRMRPN